MGMPGDVLATTPHTPANYITPYDRYTSQLMDYEMGGLALNDPSLGLEYQVWRLHYNDDEDHPDYGDFTVIPEDIGAPEIVLNVPYVRSCCLAFNQNMDVFIGYELRDCTAAFYWWDPNINDYTTTALPAGSKMVQACLDDHRESQLGTSDIILAYIRAGILYTRKLADRFTVEYNHGVVGGSTLYKVGMTDENVLKFDIRGASGVRISDLVGDLCSLTGMKPHKFDVADLDTLTFRGFSIAQEWSASDAIRSVQRMYLFDFPEFDKKLRAVPRGGDPVATITYDDAVVEHEFSFETGREQGVEYPRVLRVAFQSAEVDYTPTSEPSEIISPSFKSHLELDVESAFNHTAQDAAERARALHRIALTEMSGTLKIGLNEEWWKLVPSSVILAETEPSLYRRFRIQRMNFVDGVHEIEAVLDRVDALNGLSATASTRLPPTPPPPTISMDTLLQVMDLPCLRTTHDDMNMYVAVGPETPGPWFSARVQQLIGVDWITIATIGLEANMGVVEEAMGYGSRYIPDTTNTLLASLPTVPDSVSDEVFYGTRGNMFLVGGEIIQVRDWVDESGDSRGSYLLRGRLDTTPVAHSIGERVVRLDDAVKIPLDPSFDDTTLTLRAVSQGAITGDQNNYSYTGVCQTEWAPIDLVSVADSPTTDDWAFSWTPRYRLGGFFKVIPAVQFYGWVIRFTVGATTVAKTIMSRTPEYVYTLEEQTADFGSAQASFDDVEIRALNYYGGEGRPLNEAVS